jgi:pyrroloquinoline quinone biosynthesis protein B
VIVKVLGSAAGGGFPQWNCRCRGCEDVRGGTGSSHSRLQSSIAVRANAGPWFLVNASPDIRLQLESLGSEEWSATRASPIAAVLLTDAEIDHTAGLLALRESRDPLRVIATDGVRRALERDLPLLTVLEGYCDVDLSELVPGQAIALDSALSVEAFAVGGDAPRYVRAAGGDAMVVGLTFHDHETGKRLTYAPCLGQHEKEIIGRLERSDCVLVDGTFWSDDELSRVTGEPRTARQMGHVPLDGESGSLAMLSDLEHPRRVLVHINNTNPVLLEESHERALVRAAGVEVGYDGIEIEL